MVSLRSDLAGAPRRSTTVSALNVTARVKLFSLLNLLFACLFSAQAADSDELLNRFLESQKKVKTWSADVTQTRTSKSFSKPLIATGKVWFSAPNRFHWELGQPPQTVAVRTKDEMFVIYPRLKRAEKYPLDTKAAGQWKDMMSLLDAGFPQGRTQLEAQFKIVGITVNNEMAEMILEPRSSSARKMMPQFKIGFSTNDFTLTATEMQFADGSTMRNDFKNGKVNETIDPSLFEPKLGSDYKVVEPMKSAK
jgi:outer membrane lipoprotein-sorting protein